MLVTERLGKLKLVRNGKVINEIKNVPNVISSSPFDGLLDIKIDPDFKENSLVYLSYTKGNTTNRTGVVYRARLENNSLVDGEEIYNTSPAAPTGGPNITKLLFLKDKSLIFAVGSSGQHAYNMVQRLDGDIGKIIRINRDGSIPKDNLIKLNNPNSKGMMESSFDLKASPANTHVIRHAGKILTLEEAHLPWSVDENLDTIDSYDFNGKLNGPMTAHPRICPETGELLFFGYQMMKKPYLTYHRVSKEGVLVQSEEIDIPRPVMMHDWNITRNYVIFMDLPLVFDIDEAVNGSDPFGFKPECGARLGVMPRNGSNSDIKWIEINPCFVFHPMNAYEEGDSIILHVCRQNKAMVGGMDEIYGGEDTTGKLWKWTINLTSGSCLEEICSKEVKKAFII